MKSLKPKQSDLSFTDHCPFTSIVSRLGGFLVVPRLSDVNRLGLLDLGLDLSTVIDETRGSIGYRSGVIALVSA